MLRGCFFFHKSVNRPYWNLTRETGCERFWNFKKKKERKPGIIQLGRVDVEGGTPISNERSIPACTGWYYFPTRLFSEINEKNEIVHYSPYNGEVLPGYMYTDNGFWDTFRAAFPFCYLLMYPDVDAKIMEGLVNAYKESGWLPEWASPGHRDCMIGSNSASLIADAHIIKEYEAMTLKHFTRLL